jgi:hypothetical protein
MTNLQQHIFPLDRKLFIYDIISKVDADVLTVLNHINMLCDMDTKDVSFYPRKIFMSDDKELMCYSHKHNALRLSIELRSDVNLAFLSTDELLIYFKYVFKKRFNLTVESVSYARIVY